MKKFFGVLITIAIIFSVGAISAFAESIYIRGDADGDGTVTCPEEVIWARQLKSSNRVSARKQILLTQSYCMEIPESRTW